MPLYDERDAGGLPTRWLGVIRRAIETGAPRFRARRMVKEYVEQFYLTASAGVSGMPGR